MRPSTVLAPALLGNPVDPADHLEMLEEIEARGFASVAFCQTITIAPTIDRLYVHGHNLQFDGGFAWYQRTASGGTFEPSHPGKFADASGFWFELIEDTGGCNICQFGADRTGAVACDQACSDALDFAIAKDADTTGTRGVTVNMPDGEFLWTNGNVYGGTSQTLELALWNIKGTGRGTIVRFKPTSAAKFSDDNVVCALFDGGTPTGAKSTRELVRGEFSDFVLLLDASDVSLTTSWMVAALRVHEQNGVNFVNVEIANANVYSIAHARTVAYIAEGAVNGAEIQFYGGELRSLTHIGVNRNPQAVGHEFFGTNYADIRGNWFLVEGGAMTPQGIFGGKALWATDPHEQVITGTHTGLASASDLEDSIAGFTTTGGMMKGYKIKNVTDGSHGFVTQNTTTTATAELMGGATNVWNPGDAYEILPLHLMTDVVDASGLGTTNHTCVIRDIKPEMRSDERAALVRCTNNGKPMRFLTDGLNLTGSYSGTRSIVTIGSQHVFEALTGVIPDDWWCMMLGDDSQLGGDTWDRAMGHITIRNSDVTADLSENITYHETPGRFEVLGSAPARQTGVTSVQPVNFCRNGLNSGPFDAEVPEFQFNMVPSQVNVTAAKRFDTILPYGHRVVGVDMFLPGAAGSSTVRQIRLEADPDGTPVLLASASGPENADIMSWTDLRGTANGNLARTTAANRALAAWLDGLTNARRGMRLLIRYQGTT